MIDIDLLLYMHETLENTGKSLKGIRDNNLLYSAIQGQQWFDSSTEKIIWVSYSTCAGHIFVDGNKRTAFLVLRVLSKYGIVFNYNRVANVILDLASGKIRTKEQYFNLIDKCIIK